MNKNSRVVDVYALFFLAMFSILFATKFVDFSIAPSEDAAMLMRYAEHFAHDYGIVWNIGEKPVDGATDFLFMIFTGYLVKMGLSFEYAVRSIGFLSHVLTVLIVYLSLKRLCHAPVIIALISSIYLAMGHGLYYVAAYFGTPFFALFACITWYVALSIILKGETWKKGFLFAVFSLITALIRPEGAILSGLILLTIIYIIGLNRSRATIVFFFTLFLILGGSYFLWRWHYFGYPLPNAFYKKGGWKIHLDGLNNSILQTLRLCFLISPAYLLGLYSQKTFRLTIGFAIPLIGFTSAFILLSREMNYGARFQYVLLPMTLMSWWLLLGGIKEYFHFPQWCNYSFKKRVTMSLPIIIVVLGILYYQFRKGSIESFRDGRYDVAVMLSEYKSKGYRIATTEAGLLPLYSHWRSLDTWGLNDQWIAHHGKMTEEYLNSFKPNVIMFHVGFSPIVASDENSGPWYEMVMIMKSYAEKNNYVLAAAYGDSPYKTHYYYVQQDFPESQEIVNRIRNTKYSWYGTGRTSMNYAIYSMNIH